MSKIKVTSSSIGYGYDNQSWDKLAIFLINWKLELELAMENCQLIRIRIRISNF